MAALTLPAWARPRHPVVHNELRHWRRSRVWRGVRYTLWGGSLTFLLLPAACSLLFSLGSTFSSAPEAVLAIGGTFTLGLVVVSSLANWLNSLTASLLGATLIARERECQSWPFLRLTTLSSVDIVGGKFAALLYTLANPLLLVTGLRLLALASGALTAVIAYRLSGLSAAQVLDLFGLSALSPVELSFLRWLGLVGVPVSLVSWLAEPCFGAVYNGAVGVAASTLARSRGSGIILTIAAHLLLTFGVYVPTQQVATLAFVPFVQPEPTMLLLIWGVTLALGLGLRVAIVVGSLIFTLARVEQLSD